MNSTTKPIRDFEYLDAAGCFDYLYEAGYSPHNYEEVTRDHKLYTQNLQDRITAVQLSQSK